MAYQALYRKYRPHNFDDFIDQDYVKKILLNSILSNKISHAYLFSGPRGIGKTSMAKIFAKAINCLNFDKNKDVCDECENCIECDNQSVDIIEIDAASNNGVDQIRELKNKISIVPSKLKYKVYIIDEVHMLTNSAFNALLKTLEEPPSHVIFILATTEFYSVPETIVSRCQCYNFTRISLNSLNKRLRYIADKENIDIDDETINEISNFSNGGLRDAIGMLDKLNSFSNDKINIETFKDINGIIANSDIEQFYNYLFEQKVVEIIDVINKIENNGYDFKNFIERVMILTRNKIIDYYVDNIDILGKIEDNIELVSILNDLLNKLKDAINPIVIVQIMILKFINYLNKNISQEIKSDEKIISQEIKINNISINKEIEKIRINNSLATANINYKHELEKIWQKLNKYFMDTKYGKISQLFSDVVPMVVGNEYILFTSSSDGLIENIYSNLNLAEDFIEHIYRKARIVVVNDNDFSIIKEQYVKDKNNKITYHVIEECDKLINENNDLINQALNIFGPDYVEIE